MGFLAPWFLGGLAALGVPVFVHLLRRHITTPRRVSSLMFFERGTQSSTRHRRLKYLLLIVLDNSFSMRAGTRFADAKQQALTALAAKSHDQKAQIMALGGQLAIL